MSADASVCSVCGVEDDDLVQPTFADGPLCRPCHADFRAWQADKRADKAREVTTFGKGGK